MAEVQPFRLTIHLYRLSMCLKFGIKTIEFMQSSDQDLDFLGVISNKFQSDLARVSIVEYVGPVSEDWHYHPNAHLSSILRGGNLESRKKDDIQVMPGKIIPYRAGEIHRNRHTVFPSQNLNIELKEEFFTTDLQFSNFQAGRDAYFSMLKIYHEFALNDPYSSQVVDQQIRSMFWRQQSLHTPVWVQQLIELLNDRWDEFIPLSELSEALKLHPVSISKHFAKYAGCTLGDYMRKIKLERASELMLTTRIPATTIAYQCGFSDQSHMTRLFKHYLGCSPKQLRSI